MADASISTSLADPKMELERLVKLEGNDVCVDCGRKDPEWASVNLGVFLCIECSGIHRSLGAHISKVKSLKLDSWNQENVEAMQGGGNKLSKKKWEVKVHPCWKRPTPEDSLVVREQWIKAKYERKEFVAEAPEPTYATGKKKSNLYKRKKDRDSWNQRLFDLDGETLKYYVKGKPKEVLPIVDLNVTLNSETGHPNGLQMIACVKQKTRNYFVYSESAQEIVEWYCSIRAARLKLLSQKNPGLRINDIISRLSKDFIKYGWVQKTPPPHKANKKNPFQRRWFVLYDKRLLYFDKPQDANPLGEILLGNSAQGYGVTEECPPEYNGGVYAFLLKTPIRDFPLIPDPQNDQEKASWVSKLKAAIEMEESGGPPGGHSYETD